MRPLLIYVDASVIGGCEDTEFSTDTLALWRQFVEGLHILALSEHTLGELRGAPEAVRHRLTEVPEAHQVLLAESPEAEALADAYVRRGVVGRGSRADALHVALSTVYHVDVLESWNFRHMVNFDRIRLFNSVNLEWGYGTIEIRTPKEILSYDEEV